MTVTSAPPIHTAVAGPDDLVQVSVWVPARSAVRVQSQMVALAGQAEHPGRDDHSEYSPRYSNNSGPDNAWDSPVWEPTSDRPAATWLLHNLGDGQRRLVGLMLANGPVGTWTYDMVDFLGLAGPGSVPGVLRAIAGRCRAAGRRPFWNGGLKDPGRGQLLPVPIGPTRDLFIEVMKEDYPELAAEFSL